MEYGDQFIEQAKGYLTSREHVHAYVLGFFDIKQGQDVITRYGVLFATNKHIVLVLARKLFGHELEHVQFSDIVAVEVHQHHQGLALTFSSSQKTVRTNVVHMGSVVEVANYVKSSQELRNGDHQQNKQLLL